MANRRAVARPEMMEAIQGIHSRLDQMQPLLIKVDKELAVLTQQTADYGRRIGDNEDDIEDLQKSDRKWGAFGTIGGVISGAIAGIVAGLSQK